MWCCSRFNCNKKRCDNPGSSLTYREILRRWKYYSKFIRKSTRKSTFAADVKNPITGEVIIKKGEMIDEAGCEKLMQQE